MSKVRLDRFRPATAQNLDSRDKDLPKTSVSTVKDSRVVGFVPLEGVSSLSGVARQHCTCTARSIGLLQEWTPDDELSGVF